MTPLTDVIDLSRSLCSIPIQGRLAYATCENFLGRIVDGYHPDAAHICPLALKAANQLCQVQNEMVKRGLSLFVFDAFRPLRAVRDFSTWFREPVHSSYEIERKQVHYPHLCKQDLSRLGYVSDHVSKHCFGHAVDLSLIEIETKKLLNMGTVFDFFGTASHGDASSDMIGQEAVLHRQWLKEAMQKFDFLPYPCEWWHFEYKYQEIQEPLDIEITVENAELFLRYLQCQSGSNATD